jgi:hypothetical protein
LLLLGPENRAAWTVVFYPRAGLERQDPYRDGDVQMRTRLPDLRMNDD